MQEQERWMLRNVMVMTMADGKVTDEEKKFIERLREKLGVDAESFRQLCQDIRENPKLVKMPSDLAEAEQAIRLMAEAAAADGPISPPEQQALERLARHAGVSSPVLEVIMAQAEGADLAKLEAAVAEIYVDFANWDAPTRSAKFAALGAAGRPAVLPLLRMLESYRSPDGAADPLEMRILVIDQLKAMSDIRSVYYLAQQIGLDGADEVTNPAVRAAAAEAIGHIVDQPFTRDDVGVAAARQWWRGGAMKTFDTLVL
jgi:uncharacterized tellurite resistance protein B-like protein